MTLPHITAKLLAVVKAEITEASRYIHQLSLISPTTSTLPEQQSLLSPDLDSFFITPRPITLDEYDPDRTGQIANTQLGMISQILGLSVSNLTQPKMELITRTRDENVAPQYLGTQLHFATEICGWVKQLPHLELGIEPSVEGVFNNLLSHFWGMPPEIASILALNACQYLALDPVTKPLELRRVELAFTIFLAWRDLQYYIKDEPEPALFQGWDEQKYRLEVMRLGRLNDVWQSKKLEKQVARAIINTTMALSSPIMRNDGMLRLETQTTLKILFASHRLQVSVRPDWVQNCAAYDVKSSPIDLESFPQKLQSFLSAYASIVVRNTKNFQAQSVAGSDYSIRKTLDLRDFDPRRSNTKLVKSLLEKIEQVPFYYLYPANISYVDNGTEVYPQLQNSVVSWTALDIADCLTQLFFISYWGTSEKYKPYLATQLQQIRKVSNPMPQFHPDKPLTRTPQVNISKMWQDSFGAEEITEA